MSLQWVYISVGCIHTASIFIFHVMRRKDTGEEHSVSHQTPLTYGILSSSRSVLISAENARAIPVTMARDFLCLLAVVIKDRSTPSREPKEGTFQRPVVTFKGIVEIITQGQVGKEMRVLVDLSGEDKGENSSSS